MRGIAHGVAGALVAGILLSPVMARAAADESVSPEPADSSRLEWRWQRFRAWEYPVTALALSGAFYLRLAGPQPSATWTGGILADDWVEQHTAIQNVVKRRVVINFTDLLFYGSMGYRLIDSAILPSLIWRSPDVAFQMSLIDLESFGFVALTLWGQQALLGRERPYVGRCNSDPAFASTEGGCPPTNAEHARSFFAGHPAVVLTAAGLTCTHHAHLPLYGGGGADKLACGVMIGAAAVTGVGRLVTEEHHLSDVVVGYGIGVIAGWALPELLHYGRPKPQLAETPRAGSTAVRVTLAPVISQNEVGLGVHGAF